MKKATKLLLSILPISSISLLGVVSCSTTNSNAKQPDKIPIIPKNPNNKKPINNNNNSNNSNNNSNPNNSKPDSTVPNENKDPSKPEETPKEPERDPKKPEENQPSKPDKQPQGDDPNNNVQPHNDESDEQPNINKDEFIDLVKLPKEISFERFDFYTSKDATTALSHLRTDGSVIKLIFSSTHRNIFEKYNINLELDGNEKEDVKKGLIDKVKVKFTNKKDKKSKIIEFTFTGFKVVQKTPDKEDKNSKKNYIKKKEKIDNKLTGLYPSLVAYMIMYTQEPKNYKNLMQKDSINFEELENNNPNLFANPEINLNVAALKDLLLQYNRELGKLYKDKVIAVSYDDVNGKLGLKLLIENIEENNTKASKYSETLEFGFDGFRKIDLKNPNKNVLSLLLPQNSFKDMIKNNVFKEKIEVLKSGKQKEDKLLIKEEHAKQLIFKNLLVQIIDNENNLYRATQTLSLQNNKKDNYTSILGLAGGGSLYPFHTIINNDSIKNIYLTINKEDKKHKVTINFEVDIPIFASTTSDLTSHATSGDTNILKLDITTNALID
ncbi:LppA family lipoprotein [Mycoplasma mycoides]|uniref:LppA family lipoprotein n=1 Tax=Mycoplasma mycoides TaxID=2102 RepID=UPI00224006F5|nr:LppA family lipoprotein [Mycoplasma mycoides]QVK02818.1 LppA family lipoprotein [Mycoplasma mycoides subsp. capri]QVK03635.1 LppA family lipoprotein [Mycoplasma mycoides subsp. capri]